MGRIGIAALLLAHGLIHAAFLAPRPAATAGGPAWPFDLGRSWLLGGLGLGPEATRWLGIALVATTLIGFALAAFSLLGIGPDGLLSVAMAVGAIASSAVLVLYFHPWLVLGLAIDVVVLWVALIARWAPDGVVP